MGSHRLRAEKTCLNCGGDVPDRFCGHCGQENAETRHSFHYLITHFIEDFTHYDGNFWKTLKSLFFQPGALTIQYLQGRRVANISPVKLYIFVSFITFLLISILPKQDEQIGTGAAVQLDHPLPSEEKGAFVPRYEQYVTSTAGLDSLQQVHGSLHPFELMLYKKAIESGSFQAFGEKVRDKLMHNIPKILFIYLPFFTFFLWLFYDKKKWWYYEHGVFTLYYFSFLLLATLSVSLLNYLSDWIGLRWLDALISLIGIVLYIYTFLYIFIALRRVYRTSRRNTAFKVFLLFTANLFLFIALTVSALLFTIYTL